jgi:hypothetical protein
MEVSVIFDTDTGLTNITARPKSVAEASRVHHVLGCVHPSLALVHEMLQDLNALPAEPLELRPQIADYK